jgi:phosphate transport system protein
MVDKAVGRSIEALKRRDRQEAERIIADDALINKKRYEIEEHCMELIVTQQPMAGDLRFIITVLHIATDLERMGDHAEGIAKINILMGDEPLLKPLVDIPRMADKAREMLRGALDAFIARDAEAARRVAEGDDDIDNLYNQVYRELLTYMLSDPRTISRATHLLWVAHNLERFADRVTNICERVVFNVTGRLEEMNIGDAGA